MNSEDEIDYLRTYKDFIYFFNMLERNVGYCLRHCTKRANKNPDKWLTASFDSKIKKVYALVKSNSLEAVFNDWLSNVEQCRYLRNIIAHGEWEWIGHLEKPIRYHLPEIPDGKGAFTAKEFRLKLQFLQQVIESFHEIRPQLESACEKQFTQIPNEIQNSAPA